MNNTSAWGGIFGLQEWWPGGIDSNSFRGCPFFLLWLVLGFSSWIFLMGMFRFVSIGCDTGLILGRRVDTWVDPYDEWVGFVVLNC
ncbi:MAG TPA: hypothetical protein DDZ90_00125, partial [Planctomycetaceae bacterium]|nr:hypothetical protein [Planctomycetaceae bacterium]